MLLSPPALLAALASLVALVAARERRHRDMGAAAGIAAALSPAGLVLLPVLAGVAIARRTMPRSAVAFAVALSAMLLTTGWSTAATDLSVWRLALIADQPDLRGPVTALAVGMAAWIGASCAARPPSPRELDGVALFASATLPLLVPIGAEALLPALALLLAGVRPSRPRLGANDNPLPLRAPLARAHRPA